MADVQRLVILGSSVTALALVREGYRLGLDCIVVDRERGIASRSRLAKFVSLGSGEDDVIPRIAELGGEGSSVIATSDSWLRVLRQGRTALDSAFANVPHASNQTLEICLDKLAFARWCVAWGVPTPASCSAFDDSALAGLKLPLLLRPSQTRHDIMNGVPKAVEVNDRAELDGWLAKFQRSGAACVAAESLLGRPLEQLAVPIARRGGRTLAFAVRKVRPAPDRCGVGTYLETCDDPAAIRLATHVVESLDLHGIGEVEILRDTSAGGLDYVVEVNARPWTQFAIARAAGFDFLGFALGITPAPEPPPEFRPVRWIDFTNDFFVVFSRQEGMFRRGEIGWRSYLGSLGRANAYAKFAAIDPWPSVVDFTANVFSRFRSRRNEPGGKTQGREGKDHQTGDP